MVAPNYIRTKQGFPDSSAGKEFVCNAEDPGSIPGSGRSAEEGIGYPLPCSRASLGAQLVKNHLQCERPGFDSWVGKIPWRSERLPTPVFCPGQFHRLYRTWRHKELDTTEWLSVQFSSVQSLSRVWLCDPMNHITPGLPVHHQLPEFTQTHVHWVSDAIQPSYPLLSHSPSVLNLSQHQGLFQWVRSSHQLARVLEFQLRHQSFKWTPRTDLL